MSESRDVNKFIIRMPDGLRERIADEAKRNGRSMNAEIVTLLEERYPAPTSGFDLLAFSLKWIVPIRDASSMREFTERLDSANRAGNTYFPAVELSVRHTDGNPELWLTRSSGRSAFELMVTNLSKDIPETPTAGLGKRLIRLPKKADSTP